MISRKSNVDTGYKTLPFRFTPELVDAITEAIREKPEMPALRMEELYSKYAKSDDDMALCRVIVNIYEKYGVYGRQQFVDNLVKRTPRSYVMINGKAHAVVFTPHLQNTLERVHAKVVDNRNG